MNWTLVVVPLVIILAAALVAVLRARVRRTGPTKGDEFSQRRGATLRRLGQMIPSSPMEVGGASPSGPIDETTTVFANEPSASRHPVTEVTSSDEKLGVGLSEFPLEETIARDSDRGARSVGEATQPADAPSPAKQP